MKALYKTLKIAICDDEPFWLDRMEKIVRNYFAKRYILEIQRYLSFEEILKTEADVVLLDIRLQNESGFTAAGKLNRRKQGLIIFCTAYEEYMFEAFTFRPFRFVRKMYLQKDLVQALKAAEEELNDASETIYVKNGDMLLMLHKKEILYIEKKERYCYIYTTKNKQYKVRETIREMLIKLDDKQFIRAHRWLVVNLREVVGYERTDILLSNSKRINVSRNAMQTIRRTLLEEGGTSI